MGPEPIVAPTHPVEPAIEVQAKHDGLNQPAPSPQQQRLADDVFTDQQGQVVAALMAAQTGLGLLHNLIVDLREKPEQKPVPPRTPPGPGEDEDR